MTAEPLPATSAWPVPPPEGYTVDDLFTLPDLPPHTELIDGSLVFVSPQRDFHSIVIDLLVSGLRRTAPPEFKIRREMTVVIDKRNGPEPDVSVVVAKAVTSPHQTHYQVADVLLAVEVVSPDSESRDRDTKPHKYASAGIQHYWRVEMGGENDEPVVYVYELDPLTKAYIFSSMHRTELKLVVPFGIDIDLTEVDSL
ncbi:Uma2 family endonuclease [Streptomyces sp. NBC_01262]|uniref:Uma2 family endonuclease n=1 Tax=Streptomyces sp. NBC_01262 TaxID=2903803 RepID=UPI002E332AF6|nr:Uma2 family endonuclease [Streptomyces sp. NBC_01262]